MTREERADERYDRLRTRRGWRENSVAKIYLQKRAGREYHILLSLGGEKRSSEVLGAGCLTEVSVEMTM